MTALAAALITVSGSGRDPTGTAGRRVHAARFTSAAPCRLLRMIPLRLPSPSELWVIRRHGTIILR